MAKAPARRKRSASPSRGRTHDVKLPSGRALCLAVRDDIEELQVRSPDGLLELRVVFAPEGPVVSLQCARLELSAPDKVSLRCRKFEVETTESVEIKGGELRATTSGNIWFNGDKIFLNCEEPEIAVKEKT